IIENDCTNADTISLIKFSRHFEHVFSERTKSDQTNGLHAMLNLIDNNTKTESGTAFYDTIAFALRDIISIPKSKGDKWIVALTDGEDFSPNKVESMKSIQRIFSQHKDIGLIVITVGTLSSDPEIQKLVGLAGGNKGILIRSEDSADGIKNAFGRAANIMAGRGNVNVESL
ncbi:hypothetical protein HDU99_000226, partial [Rhizoclosmatium hyalinum]